MLHGNVTLKKSIQIAIRFPIFFLITVCLMSGHLMAERWTFLRWLRSQRLLSTQLFSHCSALVLQLFSSVHPVSQLARHFGGFFVGSNQLDILSIIWITVWLKIARQIMFHVTVWPNLSVGSILKAMYEALSYQASSAQEWSTMF